MVRRIPMGMYSKAMFEGIRMAEIMQAEAVMMIQEQFGVEDLDEISLETLTLEKLVKMLDNADREGTREQLEARLGELFVPVIEQILMGSANATTQPQ